MPELPELKFKCRDVLEELKLLVLSGIGGAVIFGTLLTLPFSLVLMTLAYHRLRTD